MVNHWGKDKLCNVKERYIRRNRRKFMLRAHLVLVTKYRKKVLFGNIENDVKRKVCELSEIHRFQIVTMETDQDHIHILLDYDTTQRICDLVKIIKQQTTQEVWRRYEDYLLKHYWKKKIFWSDGYFACSIGEVSSATIEKYIASQG